MVATRSGDWAFIGVIYCRHRTISEFDVTLSREGLKECHSLRIRELLIEVGLHLATVRFGFNMAQSGAK